MANIICEYGLKIHETSKLIILKKEIEGSSTLNNIDFEIDKINCDDRLNDDLRSFYVTVDYKKDNTDHLFRISLLDKNIKIDIFKENI